MWYKLDRAMDPVLHVCATMGREEWIVVAVTIITVGYFCMRGFGSRTKY